MTDRQPRRGGWRRAIAAALRVAAVLAALTLVLAALRVAFWRQADDRDALARKRAYLDGLVAAGAAAGSGTPGPNLVLIVFDDLGWGDLGALGSGAVRTPHLDRLAREGTLFRHAYSASPYCSAARAGLLTGRHALRSGLDHVLQAPWSLPDVLLRLGGRNRRLPAEEITLAEILAAAGWATAAYGKWHLGDVSPSLPTDLGFDDYWGLLHSNDQGRPRILDGTRVAEPHPIDQASLTRRYTERAVRFVERAGGRPFFLYLPHTFPHRPLHAPAERRGSSPAGLYGDVVEELDASVGAVVAALERHGLAERTLVLATSDNGPWFQGSPGGLRGRKLDAYEGGMRVPLVAWWPGRVPAGRVVDTPVMGIDLLPTALELAGLPPPADRRLDGVSLAPLLLGSGDGPPADRPLLYFQLDSLRAIRVGRFKYHAPHRLVFGNPMQWPLVLAERKGPWLFDLELDPDESYDVTERHPEVARELGRRLEAERRAFAADRRGWRAGGGVESVTDEPPG